MLARNRGDPALSGVRQFVKLSLVRRPRYRQFYALEGARRAKRLAVTVDDVDAGGLGEVDGRTGRTLRSLDAGQAIDGPTPASVATP